MGEREIQQAGVATGRRTDEHALQHFLDNPQMECKLRYNMSGSGPWYVERRNADSRLVPTCFRRSTNRKRRIRLSQRDVPTHYAKKSWP